MIEGRFAPRFTAGPLTLPTLGGHLVLRRPTEADLDAVVAIHGNPATNVHNPAGPMKDDEQGRALLEGWLVDWRERGIGYWAVDAVLPEEWEGARTLGFSGVRHLPAGPTQVLNLYYRYAPAAWGRGWASAVARRALDAARAYDPETPVIARMQPGNLPSRRVAEKAGLQPVGFDLAGRPVLADRPLPRSVVKGLPLV
ncbi:hypothetical protein BIV57_15005 [Mangrovactinospora gilvigrisea]|uniref:N-acetyltransferase domain-containing protein n=1 Tax=Mangrovactinospora gilvigrisea TaxID=1428644 RepID=A0A1J7BT84_9ACTN|nr:GNAT family N-acetyltransferase [Mangrovactinospora gilvigrisea]OIV36673.1 hypothetical protein BIV57_15005 [Mangrovactinospora gilvigrisea]